MTFSNNTRKNNLQKELQDRRDNNLLRKRSRYESTDGILIQYNSQQLINFSSNDYLLLSQHADVKQAAIDSLQKYGVGGNASALVSGYTCIHEQLEQEFCAVTGFEKAVLFSSGYQASLAVINTLAKDSRILLDKKAHASLIDAARFSTKSWKRYLHNNVESLNQLLNVNDENTWIVTDGVFSMDGDIAPLSDIIALKEHHDFSCYVDDAHGFGVIGQHGKGILEYEDLHADQLDVYMTTFGKALGTNGAVVCTNSELAETLLQLARPYIYTTALSPMIAAATLASLQCIQQDHERRQRLHNNISYFQQIAKDKKLNITHSTTAIQSVIVGNADKSVKLSALLRERGFLVPAIREPTVAPGTSRLRISLCSEHQKDYIEAFLEHIESCFKKL